MPKKQLDTDTEYQNNEYGVSPSQTTIPRGVFFLLVIIILSIVIFGAYQWTKTRGSGSSVAPNAKVQITPANTGGSKDEPLACPSIQSFCEKGKDVVLNEVYLGYGIDVLPEAPIFAAFDGTMSFMEIKVPARATNELIVAFDHIVLINTSKTLTAEYTFKKSKNQQIPSNVVEVKKGDQIARIGEEKLTEFGDVSVLFRLVRGVGKDAVLEKPTLDSFIH